MSVHISYTKNFSQKISVNKVLFIDEKYKILSLKKHLSTQEYNCISELLRSKDIKKKILSFDINSKVKVILVSIKANITNSDLENLVFKLLILNFSFVNKTKLADDLGELFFK